MTHKSLAFVLALGIAAAAGAPVRAEDAGATISGAFVDGYEGLRDGILDAYETSRKGTVEIWNEMTGKNDPAVQVTSPAQTPATVTAADVQRELIAAGYNPGTVDGRFGPVTSDAIRSYQHDNSLAQDGQISQALLVHMQTKRAVVPGRQGALPQPPTALLAPAAATWTGVECIGEWNFADINSDGVVSGDEAGIYFDYQPMPGYGDISRAAFIESCRNGTLGKFPSDGRIGALGVTDRQSS